MRIFRRDDGTWVVEHADGTLSEHPSHEAAATAFLAAFATLAVEPEAAPTEAGLLPEPWSGPIARSAATGDGRDFTECVWSWRNPAESRLPLMHQTVTDFAHFNAVLAGFIERLELRDGDVWATGRYFDSEAGRAARDTVGAAGRWGVSVDPGEVEAEDICTEMNDEGWCVDGLVKFTAYQVIGVTMTPFPAFPDAWIENVALAAPAPAEDDADAIAAGGAPAKPPSDWFPKRSPFTEATPLHIGDDGRVLGHVAVFGECHTAFRDRCVTAPDAIAMSLILTGEVLCADGTRVATAPIFMGTDHPALSLDARTAMDHYAHTGTAWADVVLGIDEVGIWCAGAVRPGITDDQLRVLRASALSGDWRPIPGRPKAELCAILSVNSPGFPIPRAIAASGAPLPVEMGPRRTRMRGTTLTAGVGLGVLAQCATCNGRADVTLPQVLAVLQRIEATQAEQAWTMRILDRRTRQLNRGRAEAARARVEAHRAEVPEPEPPRLTVLTRLRRRG